jgi:pilus assembly protein CpaF
MIDVEMMFEDASVHRSTVAVPALIGRGAHCGVRIVNWRVGRQHARLLREAAGIVLEDLGTLGGTLVNGARIVRHAPVLPDDEILIGPCRLRVSLADIPERNGGADGAAAESVARDMAAVQEPPMLPAPATPVPVLPLPHPLQERRRLHAALLAALDLRRRDVAGMSDSMLRAEAERLLTHIVATDTDLPPGVDRAALCREVLDEAVGLGPLEPLLAAADITEIMVNRHDEIYVERAGRLSRHQAAFTSEQSLRWVIERIVTPDHTQISTAAPRNVRSDRCGDAERRHGAIPGALREDAQESGGIRRDRGGQDHVAQHPVQRDSRRRARGHHRRCGGAAPEP